MKAMILAAGLGTRLRPLTDQRPKALVELCGTPLIQIVIRKLVQAGVDQIVINVHHFAEKVVEYVEGHSGFGVHVEFSREPLILGTGGGLQKVARFFAGQEPFFLHNVDIVADIDLVALLNYHRTRGALATLAVQVRPTSRPLAIDNNGLLCGRMGHALNRVPDGGVRSMGYSGIQVISPGMLPLLSETPPFSLIDAEIRLCADHEIVAYDIGNAHWWDVGSREALADAERAFRSGSVIAWW
ncbi:MAG: nucleotidyltransferase family protein [candidate division KSB1 bacterium]|nr:nucleotidyltransferase family protein [candidate division KSB1 bacterium]